MGRPKNSRFPVVLQVRITEEMAAQIDEYIRARLAIDPELQIGVADAHRMLVAKGLAVETQSGVLAKKGKR